MTDNFNALVKAFKDVLQEIVYQYFAQCHGEGGGAGGEVR